MKTPKEIKQHYENGENITSLLKKELNEENNTQEIIEIAYDMQTGSYSEAMKNPEISENKKLYSNEISKTINNLIEKPLNILEAGVGEATTLHGVISSSNKGSQYFGFDLSWSRIAYARKWLQDINEKVTLCVGDLFNIPMQDNSIDIVYTSHSIEPNGGNEEPILKELYRITREYLILLEPGYELSNQEIRDRMERHGYCKNLKEICEKLNYKIIRHELFPHTANPLNPTAITIIEKKTSKDRPSTIFACPRYKDALIETSDGLYGKESLSIYPIINGIPCLKTSNAIFASKYDEFIT